MDIRSTSRSTSISLLTLRGSDTSACKTVGHRTSIFKNNETARIGGCRPCACKIRCLADFQCDLQESKKKSTVLQTKYSAFLVENTGIEPVTSCMPCKRSPERYRNTPPHESVGAGLISRCYVLSTKKVHSCILLPGIMLRLQGNFTTQFLSVSMGFAQREGHLREKFFLTAYLAQF